MQPVERLRRIFADLFSVPLENILPTSSPETIETWDSMHHLELVLALEQEFELQFSPEEIEQLLSFELVVNIVSEKLNIQVVQ